MMEIVMAIAFLIMIGFLILVFIHLSAKTDPLPQANTNIKRGDLVRLKSGGPTMAVRAVSWPPKPVPRNSLQGYWFGVECEWISNGIPQHRAYEPCLLEALVAE